MGAPLLSAMRESSALMCLPLALVHLVGHAQMDSWGMERSVLVSILILIVVCMIYQWFCSCNRYV